MTAKEKFIRAGFGQSDITPELGIQLAGDIGRQRFATEIRNPLYVRVMVLDDNGARVCAISCDATCVVRSQTDRLRREVSELTGVVPEAIICFATQCHSSPAIGNEMLSDDCPPIGEDLWWLKGGDPRYLEPFFASVRAAASQAVAALRPARAFAARAIDGSVSFNRRFILRDGTAKTHAGPAWRDKILCNEGVIDPEVGLLVFKDADSDATLGAMVHHTCHPTHGYPALYVCPDWPGLLAERVRGLLCGNGPVLPINGACGNISPANHGDPRWKKDLDHYVNSLFLTVESMIKDLREIQTSPTLFAIRRLTIPIRELSSERVEAARKLLAEKPEPPWNNAEKTSLPWDWVYAIATLDLAARQKRCSTYDYEVQAFRMGEFAFIGWPGEPFVEAQLDVKRQSPAAFTFLAHYANDSAGYLPTREAMARGGYETETANWSKLESGALETIRDETIDILKGLFQAGS